MLTRNLNKEMEEQWIMDGNFSLTKMLDSKKWETETLGYLDWDIVPPKGQGNRPYNLQLVSHLQMATTYLQTTQEGSECHRSMHGLRRTQRNNPVFHLLYTTKTTTG